MKWLKTMALAAAGVCLVLSGILVTLPVTLYPLAWALPASGCLLLLFAAVSFFRNGDLGWTNDIRVIGASMLAMGSLFFISSLNAIGSPLMGLIGGYIALYIIMGFLAATVGLSLLIGKTWSWGLVKLAKGAGTLFEELTSSSRRDSPPASEEIYTYDTSGRQGRPRSAQNEGSVYPVHFEKPHFDTPIIEKPHLEKPQIKKSNIYERSYFDMPTFEKPKLSKSDFYQQSYVEKPVFDKPAFKKSDIYKRPYFDKPNYNANVLDKDGKPPPRRKKQWYE